MRIAIVSDIHGNLAALEAVAADIRRHTVDRVLNLGDHVSGPLLPLETARFLMASGWISIAGDHDRALLFSHPDMLGLSDGYAYSQLTPEAFAWLASLELSYRLSGQLFACHSTPGHDGRYLLDSVANGSIRRADDATIGERLRGENSPVVVCGHSHFPRAHRLTNGTLIVNPGSVGLPAFEEFTPEFHLVETGSPEARYAILERTPAGWNARLIALRYDWTAMANLAAQNQRSDWVRGLLTGAMR